MFIKIIKININRLINQINNKKTYKIHKSYLQHQIKL